MESFTAKSIKCSVNKKGQLCNSDAILSVKIDDKNIGFCTKKDLSSNS